MGNGVAYDSMLGRLRSQGYEVKTSVDDRGRQTARLYDVRGKAIVILDLGRTKVGERFVDELIDDALMSRAIVAEVAGMIDLSYPSGLDDDGGLATRLMM